MKIIGTGHLRDRDLLAYVDGELDRHQAASVSRHLQNCWHCRTRLAELEEVIHELVRYQESFQPRDHDALTFALQAKLSAQAVLEGHQRSNLRNGLGLAQAWLSLTGRLALAGRPAWIALGVAIPVLVFFLLPSTLVVKSLSAKDVLERAVRAQVAERKLTASRVVSQIIEVRSGGQRLRRTVIRSEANERGSPPLPVPQPPQAMKAAFGPRGVDWNNPISPEWLNGWRLANDASEGSVRTSPGEVEVTFHAPKSKVITRASLTLRQDDWHAVRAEYETADGLAIEAEEIAWNELSASDPSPSVPPLTLRDTAPRDEVSQADGKLPLPVLESAELAARLALHRLKVPAREGFRIQQARESVDVFVFTSDEERQALLTQALQSIPYVRLSVDASTAFADGTPSVGIPPSVSASISRVAPLWDAKLRTDPDGQRMQGLVPQLLSSVGDLLDSATCLADLAEAYDVEREKKLSAADRDLLLAAVRASRAEQLSALSRQQELLASFLNESIHPTSAGSGQDWQGEARTVKPRVLRARRLILWLLAETPEGPARPSAEQATHELLEIYGSLRASLHP